MRSGRVDKVRIPHLSARTAIALCLFVGLSSCGEESSVRYKIAVSLNDNGVERLGESVWSYRIKRNFPLGGESVKFSFSGEAVAVVLPGRGVLLAMPEFRGEHPRDIRNAPEKLFSDHILRQHLENTPTTRRTAMGRLKMNKEIAKSVGLSGQLHCPQPYELMPGKPVSDCPLFILFKDWRNPANAQIIDPGNVERFLGAGVKLNSVSITIVDHDPTKVLQKYLPWFSSYKSEDHPIYAKWPDQSADLGANSAGYRIFAADLSTDR